MAFVFALIVLFVVLGSNRSQAKSSFVKGSIDKKGHVKKAHVRFDNPTIPIWKEKKKRR